MTITSVSVRKSFSVEVDNTGEYGDYVRYAPDNWAIYMGESLESVYQCEEIEQAFQLYIKNNPLD